MINLHDSDDKKRKTNLEAEQQLKKSHKDSSINEINVGKMLYKAYCWVASF